MATARPLEAPGNGPGASDHWAGRRWGQVGDTLHATPIHRQHPEASPAELDLVPGFGDASKLTEDEPADGLVEVLRQFEREPLVYLPQRYVARDSDLALRLLFKRQRRFVLPSACVYASAD